jgi:chemotaxis protein CheD
MTEELNTYVIGLGEHKVIKNEAAILSCIGLGSCVALCAYDPVEKVGGVAHIVLPTCGNKDGKPRTAKYVDTGVPLLMEEMVSLGGVKSRLVVKATGGARMFSIPGANGRLNVGERNVEELKQALAREGISAKAMEVGGTRGRTLKFFIDTGKVIVKEVDGTSIEL